MQRNRINYAIDPRQYSRRPGRSGYTLLEMLAVMTIIAVLAALSIAAYGSIVGMARESATRSTLAKIQALVDARSQAFARVYQRPYTVTSTAENILATQMFPPTSPAIPIAARKLLEAKYFPQAAADLVDPGIMIKGRLTQRGMHAMYPRLVDASGVLVNPQVTPAEILYHVLTESSLGGSPVALDSFGPSEVGDVNANGFPEFVDGWGKPIQLYRWPTRLFRPAGQTPGTAVAPLLTAADLANVRLVISLLPGNLPAADGASDLGRDPDDPLRTLWEATQTATLETLTFPGTSISGPTPSTWWTPLAVSAGPDGAFGMFAPDDVTNFGNLGAVRDPQDLADDLVSISMKVGGR